MQFVTKFLSQIKSSGKVAANTYSNYQTLLAGSFVPFCEGANITQDDFIANPSEIMERYTTHLESRSSSGSSIKQHVMIIKAAYKKIYGRNIHYTYKFNAEYKQQKRIKDLQRWFDEEDIADCLAYEFPLVREEITRKRNMLLIRLLVETGARIDEISNIKKSDVDMARNFIMIAVSKTVPRHVFFSPASKVLLQEILQGMEDIQEIFPSTGCVKKIVTEMLEVLGMKSSGDGRGPHTFRHYCATYLYYVGQMDIEDVATILGDTPVTIKSHYLHPTPAVLYQRVSKAMNWN